MCTYASRAKDYSVKLVKGGSITGNEKADNTNYWPTAFTYKSYGGNGDLWGATLTPADINSSNFGVVFSGYQTLSAQWVDVDHIRITVYYATGTSVSSERPAKIIGKLTSNSERSAKTTGKSTTNSNRSAKTTGVAGDLFSKETKVSLPTTAANLEPIYTATEVTNVGSDNDVFTDLDVVIAGYAIHQHKKLNSNNTDKIDITWKHKSSVAASVQAIRLQIFNHTSGLWETLDTESSAGVGVEFTLIGSVTTSLSSYYDANNIITLRVYQQIT
jgi:hypothetical protein